MRALAVLGVVAFHFKLGPLRAGGFAGVDVFFVISGFLMTQIIKGRLDRGTFSLLDFYQARIKRIVPAFVAMVVGVLIAGFLLVNPLVYEGLAYRAAWTLPFLSNWLFAAQGTYLNAPDHNWLLHTWSLSLEAQFYVVFPLLVGLLRKSSLSRWIEPGTLVALTLGSFVTMLWCLSSGGESFGWSFYMLWSRAWEFLAGGLCVYALPLVRLGAGGRAAMHYAGMAAIAVAMLVFHNTTPWPSVATALPVAGAAAMLLAEHTEPRWARFAPTLWLGLGSYSVYLWHWPVAAALSFFDHWSLPWRLAGAAASLALAAGSYWLIERGVTDYLWRVRRRRWTVGVPAFAAALAFTATASAANGLEALHYAFRPTVLAKLRDFRTARYDWLEHLCEKSVKRSAFIEECRFGNPKSDDTLVVGDSFAAQLAARYNGTLPDHRYGVAFVFHGGCAPISGTSRIGVSYPCEKFVDELYPYILKSNFRRVAFVVAWPEFTQGRLCLLTEPNCGLDLAPAAYDAALDAAYHRLAERWRDLREQGKEVVVYEAMPYPGHWGDPLELYERVAAGEPMESLDMPYEDFARRQDFVSRRLRAAATYAGAKLVDPALTMCPHGQCPVVRDGRPLYSDPFHVRTSMMKQPRFSIFDADIIPNQTLRLSKNDNESAPTRAIFGPR